MTKMQGLKAKFEKIKKNWKYYTLVKDFFPFFVYFMEEPFLVAILAVTSKVKRGVMKTLKETRFNNVKTVFVLRG